MPVYEITSDAINPLAETTFGAVGIRERYDLQRLLRDSFSILDPDVKIITEEFGEWEDSRRRIDLLGLDKSGNLVVIELKRTEDGGHMELQALRYAAMVSTMTFAKVVSVHDAYLKAHGKESDAESAILEFLGWDEPNQEEFAQDVRIVLASAEFSKELTTSVMWLNQRDIDILISWGNAYSLTSSRSSPSLSPRIIRSEFVKRLLSSARLEHAISLVST
jgi:hypothetical protein